MKILQGDCLIRLKELPDNSVDSIVTDPPYELGFMGKSWDSTGIANNVAMWSECLRVLKPGGHLLAFSGTRTYHRMASAIEDAGFEVRDMIEWVYGSGFPKSLNIGKAVDKLGGQSLSWFIDYILKVADDKGISRKELTMLFPSKNGNPTGWLWNKQKTQGITLEQYHKIKEFLQLPFADITECEREVVGRGKAGLTAGTIANFAGEKEFDLTKGTSEWEGWGTALKPAHEPICMARKPLAEKTVAENCLKWGVGGIAIDACRVPTSYIDKTSQGRFPSNFLHDGSDEVVSLFPNTKGDNRTSKSTYDKGIWGNAKPVVSSALYSDSGSAARFFYCAKASKSERNKGCDELEDSIGGGMNRTENQTLLTGSGNIRNNVMKNNHPTVKPVALMEYLIKMVTPKGGTVLDPFAGSFSTGVACVQNGFDFIGIEMEDEYVKIGQARLKEAEKAIQLKLI